MIGRSRGFMRSGAASIFVSALGSNVLRIISSVTLTRLLSAPAFGVVGIIMSVSVTLAMISDIGILPYVVRHREGADPVFLDEVWTLRLVRSVFLTVAMAVLSGPAAQLLGKPELAPAIAWWSLSFALDGFASMAFATAVREQQLWRFTRLELGTAALQLTVSIALAVVLRSYWALLDAMLISSMVKAILSYVMFRGARRRWRLSRPRSGDLWRFSRAIAPASILSLLFLQSDKLILARLMPLSLFGLYAIASNLASTPWGIAQNYAQKVLYPVLAAIERDTPGRLQEAYYSRRRLPLFAYHIAVGGLIGGAPLLTAILYDSRYQGVAPILQILSISSALHFTNTIADQVMVVKGKPRVMFYGMVGRTCWLVAGGVIAILTARPILLIWTFGLVEAAMVPIYWGFLRYEGILRLRKELIGLIVLAGGILMGAMMTLAAQAVGMKVVPVW